jgi:hypothetical protein
MENMKATGQIALHLGGVEVNLLSYHRLGFKKYEALGMKYKLDKEEPLRREQVEDLADLVRSYGVPVKIFYYE